MNYVGRMLSSIGAYYRELNPATLTGAIDVIVVEQENGDLVCSPFHVRFGKLGVIRSGEKVVDIYINDDAVPVDVHMKLGDSGEAFFVEELLDEETELPEYLATSPIPHSFDSIKKSKFDAKPIDNELMPERNTEEGEKKQTSSPVPKVMLMRSLSAVDCRLYINEDELAANGASNDLYRKRVVSLSISPVKHESIPANVTHAQNTTDGAGALVAHFTFNNENAGVSIPDSAVSHQHSFLGDSDDNEPKEPMNLTGRKKKWRHKAKDIKRPFVALNRNDFKPSLHMKTRSWHGNLSELNSSSDSVIGCTLPKILIDKRVPHQNVKAHDRLKENAVLDDKKISSATDFTVGDMFELDVSDDDGQIDEHNTEDRDKNVSDMDFITRTPPQTVPIIRMQNPTPTSEERKLTNQLFSDQTYSIPVNEQSRYLSDIDFSPINSPSGSRPSSPCKSDTEVHKFNHVFEKNSVALSNQPEWKWGELPQQSRIKQDMLTANNAQSIVKLENDPSNIAVSSEQASSGWGLSYMLGYMMRPKTTKTGSVSGSKETSKDGIYLDDLISKETDPEVAALYLGTPHFSSSSPDVASNGPLKAARSADASPSNQLLVNDELSDVGGSVPSLHVDTNVNARPSLLSDDSVPQSPHSDAGYGSSTHSIEENQTLEPIFESNYLDVDLSLCGHKDNISDEEFDRHIIENLEQALGETPHLLDDPNLVVRINQKYYNFSEAAKIIVPMFALQRRSSSGHLAQSQITYPPSRKEYALFSRYVTPRQSDLDSTPTAPLTPDPEKTPTSETFDDTKVGTTLASPGTNSVSSWLPWRRAASAEPQAASKQLSLDTLNQTSSAQSMRNVTTVPTINENETNSALHLLKPTVVRANRDLYLSSGSDTENEISDGRKKKKFRKTLRLASQKLKQLNLKPGKNSARFSVTTQFQGTSWCTCHIYLWRYDDKIVVSDIDGTITKSDVLGHVLPIVGNQWTQHGVARLFTHIIQNGYKIMYLSARAIGQAHQTKEYLQSIRQEHLTLPDGPLFLSPTSLITAFHREVIEKKPEEFKKSCLEDIKSIFPSNPYFGGFGNKINDVWAYRAAGIPKSHIFSINHLGLVTHDFFVGFSSTYLNIASDLVDLLFPPIYFDLPRTSLSTQFHHSNCYSSFTYWKPDLPALDSESDPLLRSNMNEKRNAEKKK